MRRAFSLHIPSFRRIHRWEGGMQCERLSVCSGHPAAAGALYGAGSGGGLSGASGRRAPHPADALRHGGGHHAGRQRVEPAAACYPARTDFAASGMDPIGSGACAWRSGPFAGGTVCRAAAGRRGRARRTYGAGCNIAQPARGYGGGPCRCTGIDRRAGCHQRCTGAEPWHRPAEYPGRCSSQPAAGP